MKEELENKIAAICNELFDISIDVRLTRPEEQFGDFATNIALQLAQKLGRPPREIAEEVAQIAQTSISPVKTADVAGPGFINITLKDDALWQLADKTGKKEFKDKTVVVEYSDPNPFKVLHAGHLYTSVVGDAIANMFERAGAEVFRVNFGGDVGLHVGRTMWAILRELGGEHPGKLEDIEPKTRAEWMSGAYIKGNNAFEDNEGAKAEILKLNKRVYKLHEEKDKDSPFARIYWTCRQWSYDYFEEFYQRIGSRFDRYIPESETTEIGLETVKKHTPGIFEKSEGATVFKGEDFDRHLHTRVFITSDGVPTYETKDIGLIMIKARDYKYDKSVVITGSEQEQYMLVVLKAVEQFAPELSRTTQHLTHGMVKLKGRQKMSSRKGNILRAVDVIEVAAKANKQATGSTDEKVVLAAVKYSFLKPRIAGDIIYDPQESVQLHGNSGPYLQYAHVRAESILRKNKENRAPTTNVKHQEEKVKERGLEGEERSLLKKISEYPEVLEEATRNLAPHQVCTYLYELSQMFSHFYEGNRVIGDEREGLRLVLVKKYADILKDGLKLLNIPIVEKM